MTGFFYICEYFEITPWEFFNGEISNPGQSRELLQEWEKLSPEASEHILQVIRDLNKK